jgi:hypothetical protein
MDNIIEPSENFDFSSLSLANPTGIQGGAYFTKIEFNNKSLYIQTPKSLTKQGFVKNGKKMMVDLMFNNNDENFISWIENLEITCQNMIYEKSESWFQDKLELNDIQSAFVSPLKLYKSGKYYLVRVNVKMNYATNIPSVKLYNESELPLTVNDVKENTNIISILEVQGIKFTSRNFQIELELKQCMVLNTELLFENCLIKTRKIKESKNEKPILKMFENSENLSSNSNLLKLNENSETLEKTERDEGDKDEGEKDEGEKDEGEKDEGEKDEGDKGEGEKDEGEEGLVNTIENSEVLLNSITNNNDDNKLEQIELNIEELDASSELIENELKEFDLTSNLNSLETITLKKPNQVYYEIYKAAREKAKKAKKEAIQAFLEAKNIKKTYMLDEIDDSDESDMDIENIQ